MLVELADVMKFLGADEEEETKIVSTVHNSVEEWVENYCHRKFEANLYVKERHDGINQENIYFKQFPVLAVNLDELAWDATTKRVIRKDGGSFLTDGFKAGDKVVIQGSNKNSGLLTIDFREVSGIDIEFVDGGVDVEDTITQVAAQFLVEGFKVGDVFTVSGSASNDGNYTILSVVAGTINVATASLTAEGVGAAVTITVVNTDVAPLFLTFNEVIVTDTGDNNVIISHCRELWIDDTKINEDNYEVNSDHIYCPGGFSGGHKNVRITYYAGYSPSNMPKDLQLAVKVICKNIHQRVEEETFGIKSYKVGDITVTCEDSDIPKEALKMLSRYRRIVI